MNILAIDQGTSGTKALVVGLDGEILGLAETPIWPTYRPGGVVEQDPMELWESILAACRLAIGQAGVRLGGVTLVNQGESVLAWDPETGKPLSSLIVWQDGRAKSICDELAPHAELMAERTGLVLDPYFSAPKLAWLRRNVTTDGVVSTSDAWLVNRLCGEFVTDAATASRSLLTGLDTGAYDEDQLGLFGLANERLPRIVANDQVVGVTSIFGDELPVGGLIVDQQAALLAQSCLDAGQAKCTFGTGAFFLTNIGTMAVRSGGGLVSCVAWQTDDRLTYCSDGQVYTAASAVRWLTELGVIAGAADLDALATDDAAGVRCVPALAGLAAPWWRSEATAVLDGMTLGTTRSHIVTAVLQGLAAQVAELADLVAADLGQPLSSLRVDGGLTRSVRFMQTVADLTQLPIEVYPSPHATPLGAAALMRKALEPRLSLAEAVADWTLVRTYEPGWTADRAAEFRSSWRELVDFSLNRENHKEDAQ